MKLDYSCIFDYYLYMMLSGLNKGICLNTISIKALDQSSMPYLGKYFPFGTGEKGG